MDLNFIWQFYQFSKRLTRFKFSNARARKAPNSAMPSIGRLCLFFIFRSFCLAVSEKRYLFKFADGEFRMLKCVKKMTEVYCI